MIFSHEARELFEQYQTAVNEHAAVVKEFSEFAKSGSRDQAIAEGFLKRMESTGAREAELLHQLQPFRLDV